MKQATNARKQTRTAAKLNDTEVDVLEDVATDDIKLIAYALGLSDKGSRKAVKARVENALWD
jgi:FixJ family two-component response regulator